jgi:hypothetical protein
MVLRDILIASGFTKATSGGARLFPDGWRREIVDSSFRAL